MELFALIITTLSIFSVSVFFIVHSEGILKLAGKDPSLLSLLGAYFVYVGKLILRNAGLLHFTAYCLSLVLILWVLFSVIINKFWSIVNVIKHHFTRILLLGAAIFPLYLIFGPSPAPPSESESPSLFWFFLALFVCTLFSLLLAHFLPLLSQPMNNDPPSKSNSNDNDNDNVKNNNKIEAVKSNNNKNGKDMVIMFTPVMPTDTPQLVEHACLGCLDIPAINFEVLLGQTYYVVLSFFGAILVYFARMAGSLGIQFSLTVLALIICGLFNVAILPWVVFVAWKEGMAADSVLPRYRIDVHHVKYYLDVNTLNYLHDCFGFSNFLTFTINGVTLTVSTFLGLENHPWIVMIVGWCVTFWVYLDVFNLVLYAADYYACRIGKSNHTTMFFGPGIFTRIFLSACSFVFGYTQLFFYSLFNLHRGKGHIFCAYQQVSCCSGLCIRKDFRDAIYENWFCRVVRYFWYGKSGRAATAFTNSIRRAHENFTWCHKKLFKKQAAVRHLRKVCRSSLHCYFSQFYSPVDVAGERWLQIDEGLCFNDEYLVDKSLSFPKLGEFRVYVKETDVFSAKHDDTSIQICVMRDNLGNPVTHHAFDALSQDEKTKQVDAERSIKSMSNVLHIEASAFILLKFPVGSVTAENGVKQVVTQGFEFDLEPNCYPSDMQIISGGLNDGRRRKPIMNAPYYFPIKKQEGEKTCELQKEEIERNEEEETGKDEEERKDEKEVKEQEEKSTQPAETPTDKQVNSSDEQSTSKPTTQETPQTPSISSEQLTNKSTPAIEDTPQPSTGLKFNTVEEGKAWLKQLEAEEKAENDRKLELQQQQQREEEEKQQKEMAMRRKAFDENFGGFLKEMMHNAITEREEQAAQRNPSSAEHLVKSSKTSRASSKEAATPSVPQASTPPSTPAQQPAAAASSKPQQQQPYRPPYSTQQSTKLQPPKYNPPAAQAKPAAKKTRTNDDDSDGSTAVTCNVVLRDGRGVTISPVSNNSCWAMVMACVLIQASKQLKFILQASASEVLRKIYNSETPFITRELVPYIIEFTIQHHPAAANDAGFNFKTCFDTFCKYHFVSNKKRNKVALEKVIRIGKNCPHRIKPFAKCELYKPLSQDHPDVATRIAKKKTVGTKNHWTCWYGSPAAWHSFESPSFDPKAYDRNIVQSPVIWFAEKKSSEDAPAPQDNNAAATTAATTAEPSSSAAAAAASTNAATISPQQQNSVSAEEVSPQTDAPAANKVMFNLPDSHVNAASTSKVENPTTDDLESPPVNVPELKSDIFQCCTSSPARDSAQGTVPLGSHTSGGTSEGVQQATSDVAQRQPSNIIPPTQSSSSTQGNDHQHSVSSSSSPHHCNSSQPRGTLGHGPQALASPNVLPRNESPPWCLQSPQQVREGESRLQDSPQRFNNMDELQEELRIPLNQAPAGSPIGGGVRRHQAGNCQCSLGGYCHVHSSPLGFGSSQGRCLASSYGRYQVSRPQHWQVPPHNSSWQGCQGSQGQVFSSNCHPQGLRYSSQQLHQQGTHRPLPLPPLPAQQQRDQPSPAYGQSFPQLPFGPSWGSSSLGQVGSSPQGHHGSHGPQVGRHTQALLGLGSSQPGVTLPLPESRPIALERSQAEASTLKSKYSWPDAYKSFVPSTHDIHAAANSLPPSPSSSVPIHLHKHQCHVDFDQVESLSSAGVSNIENIHHARRYIEDPTVYTEHLPPRSVRDVVTARGLSAEHTKVCFDCEVVEKVSPSDVKGRALNFTIQEMRDNKPRLRLINHTKDANDTVPAAPKVSFRNTKQLCDLVWSGDHMIEIDFKSYYHSFLLSPEVRNLFCFRLPTDSSSELVRLRVAPTGLSHMVYVGCSVTDRIVDVDLGSATVDTHIDNVAVFDNSIENVSNIIKNISERAAKCGITIKEDLSDIPSLIKRQHTYCGVHFDLENKTVAVPEKILNKVRLSIGLLNKWTYRSLAQHFGLLNFAAQIIDIPRCNYFQLFRFAATCAKEMHDSDHKKWDEPVNIWPSALAELHQWTGVVLKNEPRHVPKPSAPNLLMTVDASKHGWGYVALDETTGKMWQYGAKWDANFLNKYGNLVRRSTFTEPWGIYLAKSHIMSKISGSRHFLIGTDNIASRYTFNRRYNSRSYHLNTLAKKDYNSFPQLVSTVIHIAGKKNVIADKLSREGFSKFINDYNNNNNNKPELGFTSDDLRRLLGVKTLAEAIEDPSTMPLGGGCHGGD